MPPDHPDPPSPPRFFKALLVALPAGTVLLGIVAMVWYFQRDRILGPERPRSMAREPSAASLADRIAKLSGPLTGTRQAGDENGRRGLEAVSAMVEGSLGPNNMGYEPTSEPFESGGFSWRNLLAENKGERNPTEVVEVRVSMDRGNAGPPGPAENLGLAAALELAQAMAGAPHRRTVRFVFLARNRDPSAPAPRGMDAHRPLADDPPIRLQSVIDLDGNDFDGPRFIRPDGSVDYPALLAAVVALRDKITRLAED